MNFTTKNTKDILDKSEEIRKECIETSQLSSLPQHFDCSAVNC